MTRPVGAPGGTKTGLYSIPLHFVLHFRNSSFGKAAWPIPFVIIASAMLGFYIAVKRLYSADRNETVQTPVILVFVQTLDKEDERAI